MTLNEKERANIIDLWSPLDAILEPIDDSFYPDIIEPIYDPYAEETRRLGKIEGVMAQQREDFERQNKLLEELK